MNKNTPDKAVLFIMVKLAEECAEVIKACAKIVEHGYVAQNEETKVLYYNAEDLAKALGDVLAAMHVLCELVPVNVRTNALNHHNIEGFAAAKRKILRELATKRKGS